jgi:hypothetical protein
MTFKASEIPYESYWASLRSERPGISIYSYPLITVFASAVAEADATAGPENVVATYDQGAFVDLSLDSAEATYRLGLWGDVEGFKAMERGDS